MLLTCVLLVGSMTRFSKIFIFKTMLEHYRPPFDYSTAVYSEVMDSYLFT